MEILNKKTDKIPADAIYVGRGSHLGNTYAIGESGGREEDGKPNPFSALAFCLARQCSVGRDEIR